MTRDIVPLFEGVAEQDRMGAEALSEPFVRDGGTFAISTGVREMTLSPDNLVAMGASFVVANPDYEMDEGVPLGDYYDHDAVGVRDVFFLNPNAPDVPKGYRAFIDGYKGTVHYLHSVGDKVRDALIRRYGQDDEFLDERVDVAIDHSMQGGLRTICAFAVALTEGAHQRHVSGLILPEATAMAGYKDREMILEADLATEGQLQQEVIELTADAMPDVDPELTRANFMNFLAGGVVVRAVGTFSAALALPRAEVAEGILGQDPLVASYLRMSREERRAFDLQKRKAEQKNRRAES